DNQSNHHPLTHQEVPSASNCSMILRFEGDAQGWSPYTILMIRPSRPIRNDSGTPVVWEICSILRDWSCKTSNSTPNCSMKSRTTDESSVSMLTAAIRQPRSRIARYSVSSAGISSLHGPHQVAQMLTRVT